MAYHILLLSLLFIVTSASTTTLTTYIVHLELPSTTTLVQDPQAWWYHTFLPSTLSSTNYDPSPHFLHSYHHVFKGFAARLTPHQAKAMENIPGFISAHPQNTLRLHTTHSPAFLGLTQTGGLWRDSTYGRGVIIGLLDTGITPDHPSFDDAGMPPPPARWRGPCQLDPPTTCNNKLIGVRRFTVGNGTSLDQNGHGTHTAATAAGNFVAGAAVFGNANGTAAGTAPHAHIAVYKVCDLGCPESDILAAMDAAIDDGVDILSLSLGGPGRDFFTDSVAVGAFSAMERGIFVSASAGNAGPFHGSVQNGAPWVLTVGSSTTDRRIRAVAVLGNNEELDGESTFQPAKNFPTTPLPLVYPGANSSNPNASFCSPSSLADTDIRGRIVLCVTGGGIGRIAKGQAVRDAGGAAMILANQLSQGYTTNSDSHVLPATHLSYADRLRIQAYLNTSSSPTASILFRGTVFGDDRAPAVASYSGRGPNVGSLGILKPDIIGPGHNILAAWHVSVENKKNTNSNFNIISGTSMSCPHLSGIAALLKSEHPEWSPAVIKSALMTTAHQVNLAGNPIEDQTQRPANLLAMGSGHVNVSKAMDPGLVYDIRPEDYLPYLCGLNYTDQQVEIIVNRPVRCSEIAAISEAELNYPSFSIVLGSSSQTYNRTVTNVGEANSVYTVELAGLRNVELRVEPTRLEFTRLGQNFTYQVKFSRLGNARKDTIVQGFLTWTWARHSVRSPVVVIPEPQS